MKQEQKKAAAPQNEREAAARTFPDEVAHLAATEGQLAAALQGAQDNVDKLGRQYDETKRYMAENRGEIDPKEMYQNELTLKDIDYAGAFAVKVRDRIARQKDSPYFARIDFREQGEKAAEVFYIGPFSFSHEGALEIYDWRAPVSSMFYDCETGKAGYEAPDGLIEGEMLRKRQFKVQKGVLEFAMESSAHVPDEILQRELARTSDEKMKTIIATIQKEQNRIIRSEKPATLIIQGVAGSGKTSIALHRVAFLLYRFKDRITAENVAILSPNRVFGDFISGVLPELGEEPLREMTLADMAEGRLEGNLGFAEQRDALTDSDTAWAARAKYKAGRAFLEELDEYLAGMPRRVFVPADYRFGDLAAPAGWLQKRYDAYARHPVMKRLERVAEDILDKFETDNLWGDDMPRQPGVMKALKGMLTVTNTLALYRDFYRQKGGRWFVWGGKKTLEWEDVFPFLYVQAAFLGLEPSRQTRHLVIDEMQDYTPVQYRVIDQLFDCPKTILGDYGQAVDPSHQGSLDELRALYPAAGVAVLNKSYRSTCEIMAFARRIRPVEGLETAPRHGPAPVVAACRDEEALVQRLLLAMAAFGRSGQGTMGLLVKTDEAARQLQEKLAAAGGEAHWNAPGSTGFFTGVSVSSVKMAKGLEFDEVVVCDADGATYRSGQDAALLYVACTRAMHRLTLLHTGAPSPLLRAAAGQSGEGAA